MRIGIDIRPLQKASKHRGIGSYLRNLVEILLSIDHENDYIFYSLQNGTSLNMRESYPHATKSKKWIEHTLYRPKRPERLHWLWDRLFLHKALNKDNINLFHANEITSWPSHFLAKRYKYVVTVHDMIPFIFWNSYKNTYSFDYRLALKQGLRLLKRADMIISPSEATKKDILRYVKLPPDRIKVIYEGVRNDLFPLNREEARKTIEKEFGIKSDYILYIGGADFRKNIHNLLVGFGRFLERHHTMHSLVLAGEVFERTYLSEVKAVFESIEKLRLEKHIKVLGFISDQYINYLYSGADLFVFPSLYEGFGLPVLEAMACGTPVVTSHVSSLPEIAGNAALLIDPHDVDNTANAIYNVLTDNGLRKDLIHKGLERAKQFTWEKTARETLAVYKGLVQ